MTTETPVKPLLRRGYVAYCYREWQIGSFSFSYKRGAKKAVVSMETREGHLVPIAYFDPYSPDGATFTTALPPDRVNRKHDILIEQAEKAYTQSGGNTAFASLPFGWHFYNVESGQEVDADEAIAQS